MNQRDNLWTFWKTCSSEQEKEEMEQVQSTKTTEIRLRRGHEGGTRLCTCRGGIWSWTVDLTLTPWSLSALYPKCFWPEASASYTDKDTAHTGHQFWGDTPWLKYVIYYARRGPPLPSVGQVPGILMTYGQLQHCVLHITTVRYIEVVRERLHLYHFNFNYNILLAVSKWYCVWFIKWTSIWL